MEHYLQTLITDSYAESMYKLLSNVMRKLDFHRKEVDYSITTIEARIDDFYFIKAFAENNNEQLPDLNLNLRSDELLAEIKFKLDQHSDKYNEIHIEQNAIKSKNKYKVHFNLSFHFRIEENDFKRLQTLLNEMRDLINESELVNEEHKTRLLKRLEVLQAELYKKMNNFDKLWSFIGDAGSTLGNFGIKSKPFFDRMKEIGEIVQVVQQIALGLPPTISPNLLIEFKSTNEETKNLPKETEEPLNDND